MTLEPLLSASPVIQLHTAAALIAAVSGVIVLLITKGTKRHRVLGYIFSASILFTAITSLWITELRPGHFSPIHILSVITLVSVPLAIYWRRTGNIRAHASAMIAPLIGLLIAGAFTLVPGRILARVIFG